MGINRRLIAVVLLGLGAVSVPLAWVGGARNAVQTRPQGDPGPVPSPELSPRDVVRIQLSALKHNDTPEPDAGIATVFRFASPSI